VKEVPIDRRRRGFEATVPFDAGPGEYRIELMAEGSRGPEVAALLSAFAGGAAPPLPVRRLSPHHRAASRLAKDPDRLEALALEMLQSERRRVDLPPVTVDPLLAAIARSHSAEMRDRSFFGHLSPTTGSLVDRLTARGYPFAKATENVAVADGLPSAHEALLSSPAHRKNMLDGEISRVGIGVARGGPPSAPIFYLTYIFARPMPGARPDTHGTALTPAEEARALLAAINEMRRGRSLAPLRMDAAAERAAVDHAWSMISHGRPGRRLEGISLADLLAHHGAHFAHMEAKLVVADSLVSVLDWRALRNPTYRAIGIGIARRPDASRTAGASRWAAIVLIGP
jgi:uncharacterized protein YkwD